MGSAGETADPVPPLVNCEEDRIGGQRAGTVVTRITAPSGIIFSKITTKSTISN